MTGISKIVKWLLSLIITILAIATLAFYLFDQSPVPLDEGYFLSEESGHFDRNAIQERKSIIQLGKRLGLDQPTFYFTFYSPLYPSNLHEILPLREREALRSLCKLGGDNQDLLERRNYLIGLLDENIPYELKSRVIELLTEKSSEAYEEKFHQLQSDLSAERLYSYAQKDIFTQKARVNTFLPNFKWHGVNNRWHNKLVEFFQFNWGHSWVDGRPVYQKIMDALFWTITINGIAFLLLFICAIPLGKYWALHPDSRFSIMLRQLTYLLTVAPIFWIATLCIAFLTNAYGLPVFRLPGAGDYVSFSPWVLILPLLVLFMGGIGYLARQFEDSYREEMEKPYIRMALARGIPKKVVLNRYVVKNAIIPLITLAGAALPSLISGALVVEVLFNIPGMGRLTWHAVLTRDWPMIYAIILLLGVLAWLGRWAADRISHRMDPRTEMEAL